MKPLGILASINLRRVIAVLTIFSSATVLRAQPTITNQPQSQSVPVGLNVALRVAVIDPPPLAYQWNFNHAPLMDATNATLKLLNVQFTNAGEYSVIVSNAAGATASSNATLTVNPLGQGLKSMSAPGAVDMVYDEARDIIYATSGNSILRHSVAAGTNLPPLVLGGSLNLWGLDISYDGRTLIAANYNGGTSIYVVDLQNNTSREVVLPLSGFGDAGTYSVAFGNDNAALVTGDYPGSGWVSLRRYDPATDTATNIASVFMLSLLTASGDGSVIAIGEGRLSSGRVFKYDVAARQITATAQLNQFSWIHPGANRNGTQFTCSMDHGTSVFDNNMQENFFLGGPYLSYRPVGAVYHPTNDLLFLAWAGSQHVRAYEAMTMTEVARYDFETYFSADAKSNYRTRVSRDGSLLMVNVGYAAINYLRWPSAPPQISSQPASTTALLNSNATFSVAAIGTGPFRYQWRFNGADLDDATSATLVLTNVQYQQAGSYSALVYNSYNYVTSSIASLTVNGPPVITNQPQSQIVPAGTNVAFAVGADGTQPFGYQWWFNETNLVGSSSVLVLANVQMADAGNYSVVLNNGYGSATSAMARLTIFDTAPIITTQPQSQSVGAGVSVTFSVTAGGTEPLSYQWQFAGTNLPGATTASLTLLNVQAGDAGNYSVIVSNSVGPTLSDDAMLTVNPIGPDFSIWPHDVTATRGAEVTFSGQAFGSEPISYQWRFGAADIPDATGTTLLLTNVQTNNVGNYWLLATNAYGSLLSSPAALTLTPPPGFLWARAVGGTGSDAGNAVAADAVGNTYVAGYFNGTATFANSNLTSFGGNDIFIAKYDSTGQLLWLRQAGGTGNDAANAIAVDATGNAFVTGLFTGTADFGGVTLTNVGASDMFIAKFDAAGALVWARSYGGPGSEQGTGIAVDAAGSSFITGNFNGPLNFGVTNLNPTGGDVFVAKFDGNGSALWAKKAGGTGFDSGQAVALDRSGNLFVAGYFMSISAAFEGITLSNSLASSGVSDIFVARYDGNGNLLWVRKAGSTANDQALALATDLAGNVFVTGYFSGAAAFDTVTLTPVSSTADMFLAKYSSAGNLVWVRSAGGPSADYGNALAVDAGGNAYVAGRFAGTASFGGLLIASWASDDIFVAAYSTAGNALWVRRASSEGSDNAQALSADTLGNLYLTGSFPATAVTFGHLTLEPAGGADVFLAKLATVDDSALPTFTLQPSNQIASAGATVTFNSGFIGAPPVTFQWLFNGTNIAGATNFALTLSQVLPSQAGNYSVILSNANGAVTSVVATLTISVEPDFLWALGGGSATNDEILGVVCDTNGNSYVAGYFSGTMTVGGTNITSAGGEDVFVAKFDRATNLLWLQRAGGLGDDRANCIALDPTDQSVLIAGQFSGAANFQQGGILTSAGGLDIFLADFNANGSSHWAIRAGGTGDDAALDMCVQPNGLVYLVGSFQGNASIAGSGLNSAGTNDIFLAKYGNFGTGLGARSAGGTGDDRGRSITCDRAGNVYVAGAFSGTANFSGTNLLSNAGYDVFLAKYDSNLNRLWARRAGTSLPPAGGGNYNDEANAIVADPAGNVFVAGYFNNQATFGSWTNTAAAANQPDAFLAKYDGNGNVLWARTAGGSNADFATALATDFGGNAYLAGSFNGTAQFTPFAATSVGGADLFVAMYDATGRLLKVRRAGGAGDDVAQAIAMDGRGNAVVGGTCAAAAVFGGIALDNAGGKDAFATKVSFFDPDTLPVITSQPAGASSTNGANLLLAVGVSSGTPLSYQWFFNGGTLAGATNSALNLSNLQFASLGQYFVVVSNVFGAVASATATVRIEQAPEVLWTARHGGTGDDQALAVGVDAAANVYVAGIFSGTAAFGSSNLVSSGGTDIFFAKYNSLGGLLWAKKYGGTGLDLAQSLAVDASGNVFLTGIFSGTAVFGNSNLVSGGGTDLFVAKHDSTGKMLWLKRAGGPINDQGSAVTVDGAGNAYVTGSYFHIVNFGNVVLTNSNQTNFFVAKFDPAGNVVWAKSEVGVYPCQGNGVALDAATNVYVTGFLFGSANFGSGVITNLNGISPFGNATVFVAKYDRNGALQWAKKGGVTGLGYGQNIAADAAGNVFATSYRRDYGGGVMLTKYDGGGSVLWVRSNSVSCCTGDYISVNGLVLDAGGNPLLAGGLTGSGPLETLNLYSPQQGFIVKYRSTDGAPFWAFKSGQMGYAAALDAAGNAYLAGRFSSTTLFGTSSNLVSSGGNDAFLVKFGVRPPTIISPPSDRLVVAGSNATLQVSTTGVPATYQWQFNGTNLAGATNATLAMAGFNFAQAGRYSVVVQSAAGWMTSAVAGVSLIPGLGVAPASNAIVLNWDGTFTLQSATAVVGPYADAMTGAGPLTNAFAPDEFQRYFRLRVPSPDMVGTMQLNGFTLNFAGSPGRRYTIQTSTNLLNWTPLMTDVFPFGFQESSNATSPQKFYRTLLTP